MDKQFSADEFARILKGSFDEVFTKLDDISHKLDAKADKQDLQLAEQRLNRRLGAIEDRTVAISAHEHRLTHLEADVHSLQEQA